MSTGWPAGVVAVGAGATVPVGRGVVVAEGLAAGVLVAVFVAATAVELLVAVLVGVFTGWTTMVPIISVGCTVQWYVYVPATVNVTGP